MKFLLYKQFGCARRNLASGFNVFEVTSMPEGRLP